MSKLTSLEIWQKLVSDKNRLLNNNVGNLFESEENRIDNYKLDVDGIYLDYSKNIIDRETFFDLMQLAKQLNLNDKIEAMFRGEKINFTEDRSVLHVALRDQSSDQLIVDGKDIKPDILNVLARMKDFSTRIIDGRLLGQTGKSIKNIVNIGIGGSDLGPLMTTQALENYANKHISVRFVSNIDLNALTNNIEDLDPAETLFIVSSKTFTTDETMTNADSAKSWIVSSLGQTAVDKHFVAVSTNREAVVAFGINPDNMFEFWDFVGGRYSLCSAIGLSLMIAIGPDNFSQMLEGFNSIDTHFRKAPLEKNIPVILALLSIWYINFWNVSTEAVIPYNENLRLLPLYLQQLMMESNGKSIDFTGNPVDYNTESVIWGSQGTNSQHAYFQLFHQGTRLIPVDFIGYINSDFDNDTIHQKKLLANMLAQSRALAFGNKLDTQNVFESMPGNRPSNVLLFDRLSPRTLGQLIAIYEHKTFVEGVIWQINSFDQYGVNLGKDIAKNIYSDLSSNNKTDIAYDQSTVELIRRIILKK